MVAIEVTVQTENDRLFDDDGWMTTPLLEMSINAKCASYRYAYAEMLQMWGQPLARLEIMKFNILKEEPSASSGVFGDAATADSSYHESYTMNEGNHSHNHSISSVQHQPGTISPNMLLGGPREQLQVLRDSGRGLDVTGLCWRCELQLEPFEYSHSKHDLSVGGAAGICEKCGREQKQLRCVYCAEPVDALYPPCLWCGCVSHEHCLAEWHAAGETQCPAGDECECVEEASRGQVESWTAMKAQMARDLMRMREVSARVKDSISDDKHKNSVLSGRTRRKSVPARMHQFVADDDSSAGGAERASLDMADRDAGWEQLVASPSIPSAGNAAAATQTAGSSYQGAGGHVESHAAAMGGKPSPLGPGGGQQPISAARLSLHDRLRPSALRRQSGGVLKKM